MRWEFFLQISLKFVVHKLVDRILAAIDRILAAIDRILAGLTVFWRGFRILAELQLAVVMVVFLLDPSTFVNAKKRTREDSSLHLCAHPASHAIEFYSLAEARQRLLH